MYSICRQYTNSFLSLTLKVRDGRIGYFMRSFNRASSSSRTDFVPFETMVEMRRKQARCSVVVEIPKSCDFDSLKNFFASYGSLHNLFSYTPSTKQNMLLLEFSGEECVQKLLKDTCMRGTCNNGLSIQIPFLKLIDSPSLKMYNSPELVSDSSTIEIKSNDHHSESELLDDMNQFCSNVSEQIQFYYDNMKMTEIGWRIRFMTCLKMEYLLPSLLAHHPVLPFGSSVNTFGKQDCDLDVVLDFDPEESLNMMQFPVVIQSLHSDASNGRSAIQRNIELFADIMKRFMPGFSSVTRILHARVPIIKCNEQFTGLECDISIGNISGFHMSHLLYLYGCCDPRVRPLVFIVRYWAKERRLTDKRHPGRFISNFSLSLMVLFYLTQTSPLVIPPLKDILPKNGCVDSKVDLSHIPITENVQSLEDLLKNFFKFYATFEYNTSAISIINGNTFTKPDRGALYIVNPIDAHLNVSANVNFEEVERIREECSLAYLSFDGITKKSEDNSEIWGLHALAKIGQNDLTCIAKNSNIDLKNMFENESASTSGSHPSSKMVHNENAMQNHAPVAALQNQNLGLSRKALKAIAKNISMSGHTISVDTKTKKSYNGLWGDKSFNKKYTKRTNRKQYGFR